MPTVVLEKCHVLQFDSRPYKAKDGSTRNARSLVARYGGKIYIFAVSPNASDEILQALQGEQCSLILELSTFGKELEPKFSVLTGE